MKRRKPNPVIEFIDDHKVGILLGTLAVVSTVAVLQRGGLRSHNEFLKQKGLLDEYYTLAED
jgi:hypothetical protein